MCEVLRKNREKHSFVCEQLGIIMVEDKIKNNHLR